MKDVELLTVRVYMVYMVTSLEIKPINIHSLYDTDTSDSIPNCKSACSRPKLNVSNSNLEVNKNAFQ